MSAPLMMPPELVSALPSPDRDLPTAYAAYLEATGRGNVLYARAAARFFAAWPQPQEWAQEPLETRLAADKSTRPLLTFLMLAGHLRPGYDYLVARKLTPFWRELPRSPLAADLALFVSVAHELGYSSHVRKGLGSQVMARLLIESGRPLDQLTDADLKAMEQALAEREMRTGKAWGHYRGALHATRGVLYHLGVLEEPAPVPEAQRRRSFQDRLADTSPALRPTFLAYLERRLATLARGTVGNTVTRLAHFGRHLAEIDAGMTCIAQLDRRRHIESYLSAVAQATRPYDGAPIAISERRARIITVSRFLSDISEWDWPEAPPRRLIFPSDIPRIPRPLPRYLPPDADRRLAEALKDSSNRQPADALLLQRAAGLRIGELIDLELDCIHEIPGQGAWLKVPLGKLQTERMVPIDDETLVIVDRLAEARSSGRPLPHPRSGQMVEFLLTRRGKRLSATGLRNELRRAADTAGLGNVTPHQLRHTYATALVNAGVSLQALMALLGHETAGMSLRYGRLFDATVREDYERALAQAKDRLGPVLPEATPAAVGSDWRELPLIKARMAGGYCLRTLAQGVCPYTNICEHCPNYRSEASFLPTLLTQRVDAEDLARDAEARGWGEEAARHRRLVERLDVVVARAQNQG